VIRHIGLRYQQLGPRRQAGSIKTGQTMMQRIPRRWERTMPSMTLEARMRRQMNALRARCSARGITLSLSAEDLIAMYQAQKGRCAVSRTKMEIRAKPAGVRTDPYAPSPDRIDKDAGYVPGNVRLVCIRVNEMRSDLSDVDLFRWCRAITRAQWGHGVSQAA
jgi:hypothetical protein